jgi:hypothetical protein
VLDEVVPAIYDYAFYQTWSGDGDTFNIPDPDAYRVKRIEPGNDWSGEELLSKLENSRAKTLPYAADDFSDAWKSDWGAIKRGDELALSAGATSTGAAVFLDGSGAWSDYRVDMTADVTHATLSLIARFVGRDTPYPVCAFAGDQIYLERHDGDLQTTLARSAYAAPAQPGTYQVSMSIAGDTVQCTAYGTTIAAAVPDIASAGELGVSIWSPDPGDAEAALTRVSVTAK